MLILLSSILGCTSKQGTLSVSGEIVKERVITRAEFARLLATRLNWGGIEKRPKKVIIIDILQHPYKKEIKKLAGLRIMEVYPNHTFLPDKALSRGECAKIVENILVTVKNKEKWRKKYFAKPSPFPDVPDYHRHFNAIMLTTKKRIMRPYRNETFKPGLPLSPREARRVVRRLERYTK